MELSESERELVETLIEAKSGDALTLRVDPDVVASDELRDLDMRLGLGLR